MKLLMENFKKYLAEAEDAAIWKGYLGWEVPADKVNLDGVDQKYIDNRITRDGGDSFHITIITPPEVRAIIKNKKESKPELSGGQAKKAVKQELLDDAANLSSTYNIGDTKSVQGPGDGAVGTKGADSIAFFKVIDWNEAQELRRAYGLEPKDFHITLGIGDNGDVHGVDKK
jgi:hypothetical protein